MGFFLTLYGFTVIILSQQFLEVLLDTVPLTVLVVSILGITYGWWKRRSTWQRHLYASGAAGRHESERNIDATFRIFGKAERFQGTKNIVFVFKGCIYVFSLYVYDILHIYIYIDQWL